MFAGLEVEKMVPSPSAWEDLPVGPTGAVPTLADPSNPEISTRKQHRPCVLTPSIPVPASSMSATSTTHVLTGMLYYPSAFCHLLLQRHFLLKVLMERIHNFRSTMGMN